MHMKYCGEIIENIYNYIAIMNLTAHLRTTRLNFK